MAQEHAALIRRQQLPAFGALKREFRILDQDRYWLSFPEIRVLLELDHLRRHFGELLGELSVRCDLPGARGIDGVLSIADFKVSNGPARIDRAKLLAARANTRNEIDWVAILEEFCQRVTAAEREGAPAVDLRTVPLPGPDDTIEVAGLHLLRRHPAVLFGDGGAAKSYLALYLAGLLAERGLAVALFDWELAGEDHRYRLGCLFPDGMPQVFYLRCDKPLVHEVDRLRRNVRDNDIQFAVFDSVGYAADGAPESAEAAGKYFRAVRQIGVGSLHIAHVNKSENGDQKPFGSVFWHNSARSTWYVQRADESADGSVVRLGLFHRKANLGRLRPPLGYTVTFGEELTTFKRSDVADNPDLAGQLSVRQRMSYLLSKGPMTPEAIAEEIGAKVDTVERTLRRYKNQFIVLPGGRIGLLEKRAL